MVRFNFLQKSMVSLLGWAIITLPGLGAAQAATFKVSTADNPIIPGLKNQGTFGSFRGQRPNNDSYFVGLIQGAIEQRAYWSFDLSQLNLAPTETITSVKVNLTRFNTLPDDQPQTLRLGAVSTDARTLSKTRNQQNNEQSDEIFEDLGSDEYGDYVVDPSTSANEVISILLNETALNDIKSRAGRGFFSMGGSLVLPVFDNEEEEEETPPTLGLFSYTKTVGGKVQVPGIQELEITTSEPPQPVPEPSDVSATTVGVLLLTGLAARRYRQRKSQGLQKL